MSHWSERYFGHLYGEIYRNGLLNDEDSFAEASFAAEVLELSRSRVLDIACGHGRHSRYLAAANEVIGIDRNPEYLGLARQEVPKRSRGRAHFLQADMRALPLADRSFDAAVMLFNSFGYFGAPPPPENTDSGQPDIPVWKLPKVFYERGLIDKNFGYRSTDSAAAKPLNNAVTIKTEEDQEVLNEIARILRPGGRVLIELRNPHGIAQAVREHPRRIIAGEGFELREDFHWDNEQSVLHATTEFIWQDESEAAGYSIRLYSRSEMDAMLKQAGIRLLKTFGDYHGSRYHPKGSDYLLVLAAKKR